MLCGRSIKFHKGVAYGKYYGLHQLERDLSFEQSQFNEVDNLILACFSYVNLDGISAVTKQKGIGLKKLTKEFMKLHTMKELEADKSFIRLAPFMMMEMAKSVRFGKCVVRNYVNDIVTEAEQQFAAMEIVLEDGTSYVSFRGTDDTIIGWKEDFNLSTGVVPAQKSHRVFAENLGTYRWNAQSRRTF